MDTITQRRVPVSQTGIQKPPGVPSSAFDTGASAAPKRAQAPRQELDLGGIQIRKNVPLPTAVGPHGGRASPYVELISRMAKGDSVVLPERQAKTIVAAARKRRVKMASRKLDDGSFGVWRLE